MTFHLHLCSFLTLLVAMTTLRSFQAEIENISHEKHKIALEEAKRAHLAAELAKHHGKLPPKKELVAEVHEHEDVEVQDERSIEVYWLDCSDCTFWQAMSTAAADRAGSDSRWR